jgi:hypothetical protein
MNQNVTSSSNVEFHNVVLTGTLSVANGVTIITANNFSITDNMIFFNNGILATITNVFGNGSFITFTANNNFRTGWDVEVKDVIPSTYNGNYYNIHFANASHFIVANTANNLYVSGGTARGRTESNPDLGFAAAYNERCAQESAHQHRVLAHEHSIREIDHHEGNTECHHGCWMLGCNDTFCQTI